MAKNDFTPQYNSIDEIQADTTLLPADVVREKVKHYSMCLFGLATDMAQHEQRVIDAEEKALQLQEENKQLRRLVKKLQENTKTAKPTSTPQPKQSTRTVLPRLTPAEKQEINLQHYIDRASVLSSKLSAAQKRIEQLQQRVNELEQSPDDTKLKRRILRLKSKLNTGVKKPKEINHNHRQVPEGYKEFSVELTKSPEFCQLPHSTRCLYMHLAMHTDKNDFLQDYKPIVERLNCTANDLKLLIEHRLIVPYNGGIIVVFGLTNDEG